MDNRGFYAASAVLKMIVAGICFLILIYLGASIYGIFQDKSDLEKAELHLNKIAEKIEKLEVDETDSYLLYSPQTWTLIGFPTNAVKIPAIGYSGGGWSQPVYYGENEIPNICKNNGWTQCLCICNSEGSDILENCDNLGVCKEIRESNLIVNQENLESKSLISINYLLDNKKALIIEKTESDLKIYGGEIV